MGTYLEDFLEHVRILPSQISRNFDLIRTLETGCQAAADEVDTLQKEYIDSLRLKSLASRAGVGPDVVVVTDEADKPKLTAIEDKRKVAIQLADEKIDVAGQTYDIVDGYIRRLDEDLKALEETLRSQGLFDEADAVEPLEDVLDLDLDMPKGGRRGTSVDKGRKRERRSGMMPPRSSALESLLGGVMAPTEDAPIDPNEPTYCVCKRVSFGAMVGCENPDCPIEWFHYGCMGLTAEPKGKWYCPDCQASMDRKRVRT